MARDAEHGFEQFVDVVDELAIGHIEQFHGAVAAGGEKAFAVAGESSAKHPVALIVEFEQLLAVLEREDSNCFVCAANSDAVRFRGQ